MEVDLVEVIIAAVLGALTVIGALVGAMKFLVAPVVEPIIVMQKTLADRLVVVETRSVDDSKEIVRQRERTHTLANDAQAISARTERSFEQLQLEAKETRTELLDAIKSLAQKVDASLHRGGSR
jgi:hypothetical protein